MPDPVTGILAATSIGGALISSGSASKAANAQTAQSEAGIAELRRQYDETKKILEPYVSSGTSAISDLGQYTDAGSSALSGQLDLLGINGTEAQQAAISAIENGATFQELKAQGENSILQNASATGGLRSGNVQGALAQFSPALLNSFINQQYSNLSGLSSQGSQINQNLASLGQSAAAGTGTAGINTANNISNILGNIGSAQAGSALASGNAYSNLLGSLGGLAAGLF